MYRKVTIVLTLLSADQQGGTSISHTLARKLHSRISDCQWQPCEDEVQIPGAI
jgi:hypothetical protein